MGATVSAFSWVYLVEIFRFLSDVAIVTVILVDIILLAVTLCMPLSKSAKQRVTFFTCTTLIQFPLLLLLSFLSHKLQNKVILAKVFKGLNQFIGVSVDENLACLAVFDYIFVELLYAVVIDATVVGKIGNEASKAIVPFQDGYLVVKGLNLFRNELSDVDSFLFVVDLKLSVLCNCLTEEFLLIHLKKVVQFLDDLFLILLELVVDALSQA